ncbi:MULTISPECIES: DNA gyrase subunit A [Eubacterium]|uniref:DNA topoisomerase (ATP-hydrolyzing) n=1 Tax=Eubacterium ruminantium TaxID=42322 RepID=A0A1T4PVK6_9FIRM|nr:MULTISPECIES: DNA gyrase subunit A [Eubacterium]MCR5369005.1 topoisomerase II [Eubacterium sp.]SCW61952.1 DNA gyrase subunit A [Eubacterium ruminantium]SDN13581.1 DNA gyrase subunit A [Eubacterium ruminantium]SJZ95562.1 DNA gyrase subunit A [Eubacterium ruminantium]
MAEKISAVDYESEMGQSYVDYAMSVITERALPDVRDGLKPVQRRILYSLSELTSSDTPHRKCARIVGDTMGKYHPHGDSSIYEGLVNLAQNWKLPIPLVDPHGNFGDVSGSGAAAMRYTEARISKYAEEACMKDLKFCKEDFIPNFDGTENEPTYLPFQVPNLLVSGSMGIAVGMATNIPTHNLGEVIDGTIAYLENPDITTEELVDIIKGPDFATGGIINTSRENLISIYETGLGKIRVRGKVEIRDIGHGRKSICVTELPFTMIGGTEKFLNTVADLVRNRELPQVVDIADRGDKDGECLAIDVKKGTTDEEIENIINILYKKAGLEDTYGVNINCINNRKPEVMGLRKILKLYTEFKNSIYTRKYEKLLDEQEDIKEIKEGLLEAVDVIDLIIEILRGSKDVKTAKRCLMTGETEGIKFRYKGSEQDAKSLNFSEKQADAILAMRLSKLIGLEIEALRKELSDAEKLIKRYSKLLGSKAEMRRQMISDMEELKKYAKPRMTKISDLGEVKVKKAEEKPVEISVLLDRFYYLKCIDKSVYDKNVAQIEKDYRFSVNTMTDDRLIAFTDKGFAYIIKISDLVKKQAKKQTGKGNSIFGKLSDKGIQIFEFCEMEADENVIFIDALSSIITSNLLFVTDNGRAKRTEGAQFDVTRKKVAAVKTGDVPVMVKPADEEGFVVARSEKGYFVRVKVGDISIQGKGAGGIKLIKLAPDDKLIEAEVGLTTDAMIGEVSFSRVKLCGTGNKGTKLRV